MDSVFNLLIALLSHEAPALKATLCRAYRARRRALLYAALTLLAGVMAAHSQSTNDMMYIHTDAGVRVTRYYGVAEAVQIPEQIDGTPVTGIGEGAFSDCTSITNIAIPDTVRAIGPAAFSGCTGLTSVIIPDSALDIGDGAFDGCSALARVTLPAGITNLPHYAFSACRSLSTIAIPAGVTAIGTGTFQWCTGLASMTIPDAVTSLGEEAFNHCTSLESIELGGGLATIGRAAFQRCSSLLEVTTPTTLLTMGREAFNNCTALETITLRGSLTRVEDSTFTGCTSLARVTLASTVTNIGKDAFYGCLTLASIQLPDCIAHIGSRAFSLCNQLDNLSFGTNLATIGTDAFLFCTNLSTLTIPFGVTSIEDYAFQGCARLGNITIPHSVTNIGKQAFAGCIAATTITIGTGVTSMGLGAFMSCSGVTNVTFVDGSKIIGQSAFEGCSSLTNLILPPSIASIEGAAFSGCAGLRALYCTGNAPRVGWSIFYNTKGVTTYYLPDTSGWSSSFGGRPTQTFSNHLPKLMLPIPDQVASPGAAFVFAIPIETFQDQDPSQMIVYSAAGLPPNFTFDAPSRTLSGTVTNAGQYTLEITATDDGTPAMSGKALFTLTLSRPESGPQLPTQPDYAVDECHPLVVTNTVIAADLEFKRLTYTLQIAPAGSVIGSDGVIVWTPAETQGGTTNVFVTVVADDSMPVLSATNSFSVIVREVNEPPVLPELHDVVLNPGQELRIRVDATDTDIPDNALAFALLNSPEGASIDSASGVLQWRPALSRGGTLNVITVQAVDDGVPALTAQTSFVVNVRAMEDISIAAIELADGKVALQVKGGEGPDYVIVRSDNLLDWTPISTNRPTAFPWTFVDTDVSIANRFYRVYAQ